MIGAEIKHTYKYVLWTCVMITIMFSICTYLRT